MFLDGLFVFKNLLWTKKKTKTPVIINMEIHNSITQSNQDEPLLQSANASTIATLL